MFSKTLVRKANCRIGRDWSLRNHVTNFLFRRGSVVIKANFSTKKYFPPPFIRLQTEQDAQRLIYFLNKSERQILHKVLNDHMTVSVDEGQVPLQPVVTKEQLKAVYMVNLLPFIGFGVLDNLLMIVAGEYIDQTMGILLGISTMAAAGLGNIISDIAGVGSAHYVEFLVSKMGINPPNLTPQQWASSKARLITNLGRGTGLVIGCLIGMFPLLFYDEKEKQEKKLQAK